VHGYLSEDPSRPTKLLRLLTESATLISVAESAASAATDEAVVDGYQKALAKVHETCNELTRWAGIRSAQIGSVT